MAGDFSSMLGGMKKNWGTSQAQYDTMFGGLKIPAGTYTALLQKSAGKVSQNGRPMIAREFVITEGEFQNAIVYDNMVLDTDLGLVFLRKYLESMGFESPEDLDALPELLDAIVSSEPVCRIAIKHSGDFINVTIIEVLEQNAADAEPEPEPTPAPKKGGKKTPAPAVVEEEEEEEEEAGLPDIDDMTRAELKAHIASQGLEIKVTKSMDDDDIRAAIRALDEEAPEAEEEEEAEEEAPAPKKGAKAAAPAASPSSKELVKFAKSQGVDLDAEDLESVKETLSAYEFAVEDLTAGEVKLLEANDLGSCIIKPKAPKKGAKS